jgi:hypothetical protein
MAPPYASARHRAGPRRRTNRANGVELTCDPWEVRPGVKVAFVKGPDNIGIELAQRNE